MSRKRKTYPRYRTHPALMGCGGKGKPLTVIDGDDVMDYVGFGWLKVRKATADDRRKYPVLVEPGTDTPNR